MFFPSPYTWKVVKDAPNHIPINMIGLAHTSREIFKEGDVPILTVFVSHLDSLQYSFKHYYDRRVFPAPDWKIYLVDINKTHYWGSLVRYMYWGQKHSSE